jgi:hypothetical protein
MRELMTCKKIFCVAWLLVGDTLLVEYPDKYDDPEYRQQLLQRTRVL